LEFVVRKEFKEVSKTVLLGTFRYNRGNQGTLKNDGTQKFKERLNPEI